MILTLAMSIELAAQSDSLQWLNRLLPGDAKVIETAHILTPGRTPRLLILWMLHPERVVRPEFFSRGCSDWVYGDHWYGPTRLSLVDLATKKIINTVEVRAQNDDDPEHSFVIPFMVPTGTYHIPDRQIRQIGDQREGGLAILYLRDLTGEGVAGQFVLFDYEACGVSSTTVFGYSPHFDRAVHYNVEVTIENGKRSYTPWISEVFGRPTAKPGFWDFRWEPGHGFEGQIHELVSFDRKRQVFVRH